MTATFFPVSGIAELDLVRVAQGENPAVRGKAIPAHEQARAFHRGELSIGKDIPDSDSSLVRFLECDAPAIPGKNGAATCLESRQLPVVGQVAVDDFPPIIPAFGCRIHEERATVRGQRRPSRDKVPHLRRFDRDPGSGIGLQRRTNPSSPAENNHRPSGANTSELIVPPCPLSAAISLPVAISMRRIVPNSSPVASSLPSGEKAISIDVARESLQLGHLFAGVPIPELHDVRRPAAVAGEQFAVG